MNPTASASLADLPPAVVRVLEDIVSTTLEVFGSELRSLVLFGSAAVGRLRATSDVNLLFILGRFRSEGLDRVSAVLQASAAAVDVRPMFVLESELPAAASAFAIKFADLHRRRRVLAGEDVLASLVIPQAAIRHRLQQVLLNLQLRLRSRYIAQHGRPEQLARTIANAAGPLRASAAAICELQGHPFESTKAALDRVAASLPGDWQPLLTKISGARAGTLAPDLAAPALLQLIELIDALRARASSLDR
jgi:predicted nucleotidyltransferase